MSALATLQRPAAEGGIPLRDYQRRCIDEVHERRASGVMRQLLCLPTGSGKTIVATHLINEIGLPATFIVHRDELVKQTVTKIDQAFPNLRIAICKAESGRTAREMDGADVVVASAQTIAIERRLAELVRGIGRGGLIISDEAHHDRAESRVRAIEALDPALLIGLTATPQRGDGLGLGEVYDEVAFRITLAELVERQILARPIGIRIGTSVDLAAVKSASGSEGRDFVQSQLQTVVNTPARNALIVAAWRKHAHEAGKLRAVAFCVDVAHALALRDAFRADGVAAECIIGTTPELDRERIYRGFRDGTVPVLTNCMVLTEGWDEPCADCALMCRPTQSQSLYIQMAGRVLRKWPNKTEALIIDFVDLFERHSLQTIATLARDPEQPDAEAGEAREGEPFDPLGSAKTASERQALIRHGAERVSDLIGASAYNWQESRKGASARYVVSIGNAEYIACVPVGEGAYLPVLVSIPRESAPRYRPLFSRPVDAETAMGIASNAVPQSPLTSRDVAWRNRPPSDPQLRAMAQWRIPVPKGATAGQVSDLMAMSTFDRNYSRTGLAALEASFGRKAK